MMADTGGVSAGFTSEPGRSPPVTVRPDDLYSIGEVAALLGVSTHTIRAWERRHGIVRPARTRTRQRRYTQGDVQLLRDVKRAIDVNGFSLRVASQAARGAVEPTMGPARPIPRQRVVLVPGEADLWRTVVDLLPQFVLIVDREGTIVETNIGVARGLGVVRQRLRNRKFVEIVDPFDREKASLLYRPQPRTAWAWELNIATARGPRLYSFQTWNVRHHDRALLLMVGTEMFSDQAAPRMVN